MDDIEYRRPPPNGCVDCIAPSRVYEFMHWTRCHVHSQDVTTHEHLIWKQKVVLLLLLVGKSQPLLHVFDYAFRPAFPSDPSLERIITAPKI